MPGDYWIFTLIPGHSVGRKAIGFLEKQGGAELDAKTTFNSLKKPRERELRTRFDHWLDFGRNDNCFHGWPNDQEAKECFCFKWKEKRQRHRLYGFLYHPLPKTDPSFQICVLVYHDRKNDDSTDRAILLRCMSLRGNSMVRAAISFIFPDSPTEGTMQ